MNYNFIKKLKLDNIKGILSKVLNNMEFNYKQDNTGKQKLDIKLDKNNIKGDLNISMDDKNSSPVISATMKKIDDNFIRED